MRISLTYIESILLYLSAIGVPLYFTGIKVSLPGLVIRLADLNSLMMILLYSILFIHSRRRLLAPPGFNLLFLFIIYCFLLGVIKSGIMKSAIESIQWLLLVSMMIIAYGESKRCPDRFQKLLIHALIAIAVVTVVIHIQEGNFVRYKSHGETKYVFALLGVLLLCRIYLHKDPWAIKTLIILYPFILMSLERKGILAFHLVLFLYFIVSIGRYRLFLWLSLFGSLILLIFTIGIDFGLDDFSLFKYSEYEINYMDEKTAVWISDFHRQSLLMFGWEIFCDNWLFGVGPKMLMDHMSYYFEYDFMVMYTHNIILDTLIEYGVFGLFLLTIPHLLIWNMFAKANQMSHVLLMLYAYSLVMLMFLAGGAPSMIIFYLPIISTPFISDTSIYNEQSRYHIQ